MGRTQTYTVAVKNELHEVKADSPLQAACAGAKASMEKNPWDAESVAFIDCAVFVGKAPECIYNYQGSYSI